MKPVLRRLAWTALILFGICIGFVAGLVIAPELSEAARWAMGIAVVAIFAVSWAVRRSRGPR